MKIHPLTLTPATLLLSGCGGGPDFGPIGAGLAVIGLSIVIAATITQLFRGGGH